jgi:pantoate--beta-alanine ligase
MKRIADKLHREGKRIALVPTMGYFHEGHLSLIRKARKVADAVIVSIFVNPTQFGPNEDFEHYPRDFERDRRLARELGTDYIFGPDVKEMYPAGYRTYVEVEELSKKLCGMSRRTHFRGVTTVVLKLFEITKADVAVFGWKDAQQFLIIRKMARDLNLGVKLIGVPTVRERDGLAMSSRNTYLSPEERCDAVAIRNSLRHAKAMIKKRIISAPKILAAMRKVIGAAKSARIDYVEIVDVDNLEPLQAVKKGKTLIAAAVFIGGTRLIDNIRV